MASPCSSVDSQSTERGVGYINSTPVSARIDSYENVEKKCISDLRRTFCLFVTFDLLFITLLWIIELNLLSQGAFGYLLPISSFILVWIETWLLDFKVLPQEAIDENRYLTIQSISERAPLLVPGPVSDGQYYSPPESVAGNRSLFTKKHVYVL
ncbi:STARD3 N-terminal-like protein [Bagarius yarrelli]|uniref:STARD3 N-terminal-like protein n=1 Tax=Bagarius yarrelli TaxID=175774 RepID=A0A556TV44_BAGYA|nr:STARD3 N-terminal-like protein [Bagarius yarrelli]